MKVLVCNIYSCCQTSSNRSGTCPAIIACMGALQSNLDSYFNFAITAGTYFWLAIQFNVSKSSVSLPLMTELQYSSICHIAQILCLVRTLSSASLTGRSRTTAILVAERRFILAWIVGCWNILATIGNEGSCLQYLFLLPNILQSWPSSPNILWTRLLWHLRTKNTWRKSHLLLCAEYYWNIICVQILCNRTDLLSHVLTRTEVCSFDIGLYKELPSLI